MLGIIFFEVSLADQTVLCMVAKMKFMTAGFLIFYTMRFLIVVMMVMKSTKRRYRNGKNHQQND